MSRYRFALITGLAVGLLASVALAAEVGDAAPALKIEKWVKGGPVEVKPGDHIYVVEFWATWCSPCRAAIPHLTELQKKYKDKGVIIVGVSVDSAKTRDKVEPFVKEQGDKMDYVVALDDESGDTKKAWMGAYEISGIPCSFIIDKAGKVVRVGYAEGLDEALDAVVLGTFDVAAAKKADQERRAAERKRTKIRELMAKYFEMANGDKPEEAESVGLLTLLACEKDAELLNDFAWKLLTDENLKHRDMKLAMQAAKAAYDACDGKESAIVDTYARALFDTGKVKEAIEFERKAIELAGDNEVMRKDLEETLHKYEQAAQKK